MDIVQIVLPYKELFLGLGIYFSIWFILIYPLKHGIRGAVGKLVYRKIIKEYREKRANKYVGMIGILLGVICFWLLYSQASFLAGKEIIVNNPYVFILPYGLILFGLYIRFAGFIRAMCGLM